MIITITLQGFSVHSHFSPHANTYKQGLRVKVSAGKGGCCPYEYIGPGSPEEQVALILTLAFLLTHQGRKLAEKTL